MRPPEQIETECLLLRKPRMEDVTDVFDGWARHLGVTHFLTWRPHDGVMQREALVKRSMEAWNEGENFHYILEIKENGSPAGMVENIPSQCVLGKVGMQREGILHRESIHPKISPEPRDCYMYAIVK